MKTIFLFTLLLSAMYLNAQTSGSKEPVPEYIHITPDMSREQINSLIQRLKQWNIELSFDTLEYDPATNKIVSMSGKVTNAYYPENIGKGSFRSDNFKRLTIVTTKGENGVRIQ